MELAKALSIFSKSSPYAVSTEREKNQDLLAAYKNYIYITTDIEQDFQKALLSAKKTDIIFLCGSSGDGKSEIMTQYSQKHKATHDFHLDATHGFKPKQTAIDALNERFFNFKQSEKPLIVGVNVGMLGNYAEEGDEAHQDIKASIKAFLDNRKADIPQNHTFLDFEQYPKFALSDEANSSDFVSKLLTRLTEPKLENIFYALYDNEVKKYGHSTLTANFALLSLKSVQDNIIALLLKARLIKDQFLTARSLLDFIFELLTSGDYLFDNLFSGRGNELLSRVQSFDPSNLHTRTIDEFVLQYGLGIEDKQFQDFIQKINSLGIFEVKEATSFLRLFYILKGDTEFNFEFIEKIQNEFTNSLIESYASNWILHQNFDGTGQMRKKINNFYKDTLVSALHLYCNRHAPKLNKDEYLTSERNHYKTAVSLEVKPDFSAIQTNKHEKIDSFYAYIEVDGKPLKPMPISIKLFELLVRINQGYRPNKHDKNAVLLLDEALEQILALASQKDTLLILRGDQRYKIVKEEDDYFEVSGMHQ